MKFEDFGKKLNIIRQQKGFSAYELSLRLGKDASYINKVENGKINISLKRILQIAEELDCTVEALIGANITIENN